MYSILQTAHHNTFLPGLGSCFLYYKNKILILFFIFNILLFFFDVLICSFLPISRNMPVLYFIHIFYTQAVGHLLLDSDTHIKKKQLKLIPNNKSVLLVDRKDISNLYFILHRFLN